MIRSILTLTRSELEKRFFVREPFAVLTIRKPGRTFVRIPLIDRCVGECKLMFHDAETSPENGQRRMLMPGSQATKLVSFVKQVQDQCAILVCQCESGDSLAMSVAEPISKWLNVPILTGNEQHVCNHHVKTMVEMAIDLHEIEQSMELKYVSPTRGNIDNMGIETINLNDQKLNAMRTVTTWASFDLLAFPGSDSCRPLNEFSIRELGCMVFGNIELTEAHLYALNVLHCTSVRHEAQVCFLSGCGRCVRSLPNLELLKVLAIGLTAKEMRVLYQDISKSIKFTDNLMLVHLGSEEYEIEGPYTWLEKHSYHNESKIHLTTLEWNDSLSCDPMHLQINRLPGWQPKV